MHRPASRDTFAAALARFTKPARPLALARFHDGEYHVLNGLPYKARSGWTLGRPSWVRDRLRAALTAKLPDYWVGLSPPCDFPRGTAYYRPLIRTAQRTFATVFQHRNFPAAEGAFRRGVFEKACLVSPRGGAFRVPANGVAQPWDLDALVTELLKERRPILLAAGPCAAVIVHEYWKRCPKAQRQTILDIGATLDRKIHGRKTREYHDGANPLRHHVCRWDRAVPWARKPAEDPSKNWRTIAARLSVTLGPRRGAKRRR